MKNAIDQQTATTTMGSLHIAHTHSLHIPMYACVNPRNSLQSLLSSNYALCKLFAICG